MQILVYNIIAYPQIIKGSLVYRGNPGESHSSATKLTAIQCLKDILDNGNLDECQGLCAWPKVLIESTSGLPSILLAKCPTTPLELPHVHSNEPHHTLSD